MSASVSHLPVDGGEADIRRVDPIGPYLMEGIALAFRRPRFMVLDVAAKLLRWFVLLLLVSLAFSATLAQIPASDLDLALLGSGIEELEALVILEGLATHANLLVANLMAAAFIGILASGLIESIARGVIVGWATLDDGRGRSASPRRGNVGPRLFQSVIRHLASGITTRLVLATAVIAIGLVSFGPVLTAVGGEWTTTGPGTDARWPVIAGLVLIGLVAFSLTVLDTITRLGALALVGTRLPELVLVSAFPILTSATVWAVCLTVLAGLSSRQMLDPLLVVGFVLTATTLSSAMFLVRCGSVHGMKRDLQRSE